MKVEHRALGGTFFSSLPPSGALPPFPASGANPTGAPPEPPPQPPSLAHKIFMGPNGIRAGWRLLIYFAILFVIFGALQLAARHFRPQQQAGNMRSVPTIIGELVFFGVICLATFIMSRIERRSFADYGLPWKKAFPSRFWEGLLWGFASISLVLFLIWVLHGFAITGEALHGAAILKYGIAWGLAFVMVGFAEEFSFRGYALFTLTSGIWFWPAAILLSAAFGAVHLGNKNEDWVGGLSAGLFGFLFCLMLRRTGSLWFPIGFHAAWDWGESYFYGVPDSGFTATGHLLSSASHGQLWLSGGQVGPEGSVFTFVILVLVWLLILARFRSARYPNPAALGNRRDRMERGEWPQTSSP